MMKHVLIGLTLLGAAVPVAGQPVTQKQLVRVYEVRDLVVGPELPKPAVGANRDKVRVAGLITLISRNVKLDGVTRIEASAGQIVVVGSAADHKTVEEFLIDLRKSRAARFDIAIRLVAIPKDMVPSNAIEIGAQAKHLLSHLDAEEVASFLSKGSVVSAPRLQTPSLQTSTISVVNRRTFVKNYQVIENVHGYADGVAAPEIETVDEGLEFRTFLIPAAKGGWVTVDLELSLTGIRGAPRARSTPHGPVHDVETSVQRVKSCITLKPGATIAIFGLGPTSAFPVRSDHRMAAFVTVTEGKRR